MAQRKFFFFLDPKRTGKIYINDIITSNILTEFYELERISSKKEMEYNWFSLINFFKIYRRYVELNKDKNGMLSKKELINKEYQRHDIFLLLLCPIHLNLI